MAVATPDEHQLAQRPRAEEPLGLEQGRVVPVVEADPHLDARLLLDAPQVAHLGEREAGGLLNQDVTAGEHRLLGQRRERAVYGGDDHHLDAAVHEDLLVALRHLRAGERRGQRLGGLDLHVEHRLHGARGQLDRALRADEATADDGEARRRHSTILLSFPKSLFSASSARRAGSSHGSHWAARRRPDRPFDASLSR